MSLARNTAVQAGLTLVSRILGLARDLVITARMGAGPISDAFQIAQTFPNLFRRLFAEGAFSQAFVPLYAKTAEAEGRGIADAIASRALAVMGSATLVLTLLFQLAMPLIMLVLFQGYRNDPETFGLAVLLTQITMPYLVCMTLAALFAGVLNTLGRFALTAGAPTLLNIAMLIFVLPAADPKAAAIAGSWATFVGGILQAGLVWWGCRRLGVRFAFVAPKLTPEVRKLIALAIPGAIAGSAVQLNIVISRSLATSEVGAVSFLAYADRLYQLPLGLVGVAVGIALLPRIAGRLAAKDEPGARAALDEGVVLSMALTVPAAAALMTMPFLLIDGFFTRGAFTSANAADTARALFHFAWGVPAFVLTKVLAPPYFARENTKTPMRYALVGVVINIVAGVLLFNGLRATGQPGFVGLAAATSIAAWVNVALLMQGLLRAKDWTPGRTAASKLARVALATAAMTAVIAACAINRDLLIAFIERDIRPWVLGGKEWVALAVSLAGVISYVAFAFLFRAVTPGELKAAFQRRPEDRGVKLPGGDEL
jgi:putative peptidoglycan lipid II flippase